MRISIKELLNLLIRMEIIKSWEANAENDKVYLVEFN